MEFQMSEKQKYTESEFALILQKAIELQERRGAVDAGHGLSLSEIQAIAAEIGLEPALVEQAASLVPRTGSGKLALLFGGPSVYQMEYSVAGEIPRDDFGKLVDAIRRTTGHQGQVTEVLGSLEWQTVGEVSQILVAVSPRDGQTSVKILANRGPAAVLTFLFPGLAGLIGIGIAGAIIEPSTVPGVASIIVAAVGGAFLTSRTIWKATTARFRTRLRDMMASLSTTVARSLDAPKQRHEELGCRDE
jgi:hypothetical protein